MLPDVRWTSFCTAAIAAAAAAAAPPQQQHEILQPAQGPPQHLAAPSLAHTPDWPASNKASDAQAMPKRTAWRDAG